MGASVADSPPVARFGISATDTNGKPFLWAGAYTAEAAEIVRRDAEKITGRSASIVDREA